ASAEIVAQFNQLGRDEKNTALNETTGNILTGNYTLIPEIVNTPLGDFITSLGDIGEARLLWLKSGETYTAHTDPDDRIHLAITTNPDCYLIDMDNKLMHHLPVDGQVYLMDTGVRHVASNFGGKPRVHLNVRKKLPVFTYPGYEIRVTGGSYDWKQELYDGLMSFLNMAIKHKRITGIEKINEREMRLNCTVDVMNDIIYQVYSKNFTLDITEVFGFEQTDRLDC
ncbi:MAG: aspartyl/asparaginyl beta-hydroxylase domain-containing protein, partial [Candidatus Nanopelagicus sp.]